MSVVLAIFVHDTPTSKDDDFLGLDSLKYIICNVYCGACDTAKVLINIEIFIPEGFTPNSDGINDYFEITGIDNYPENELLIFNRWGNLVYKAKPYKNDWNGGSTKIALKLSVVLAIFVHDTPTSKDDCQNRMFPV